LWLAPNFDKPMGGSGSTYTPRSRSAGCEDIAFSTAINSPESLSGLKRGDILSLEKNARMEIVFKRANGKAVGKLFSSSLLKIINCMNRGFEYSARVESVKDGVCRVEVFCSGTPTK